MNGLEYRHDEKIFPCDKKQRGIQCLYIGVIYHSPVIVSKNTKFSSKAVFIVSFI